MKSKPENLLEPAREEEFITFPKLRERWGDLHPTNARKILIKLGIKPYRLTNRTVLFKLAEVVAAEEASRDRLPTVNNLPKKKKARKEA